MNQQQFEAKMRRGEAWHGLRVPNDVWTVVRVDGRGFSRFTQQHFQKPFDERFHQLMAATAQALLEEWEGLYAYVESDEISLLLPFGWTHFDRSVEKLVSLTAATASATFSLACGEKALFDSRLWTGDEETLFDYFRWRQSDALRSERLVLLDFT
jgi:tRNA(His) 5'-end guanylyltransferase